jgi:hypothetical protein
MSNLPAMLDALALIRSCRRGGLTPRGLALVGRHAPALLAAGWIAYAPSSWVGYRLTAAGLEAPGSPPNAPAPRSAFRGSRKGERVQIRPRPSAPPEARGLAPIG